MQHEFVDAVEQHKKTPDTFWCPSEEELGKLERDDHVKVCHNNERFWVMLTAVDGDNLEGVVDNELVFEQPFEIGDLVTFEKRNVYDYVYNNPKN